MIEIKDLVKKFDGKNVLDGITTTIHEGEQVAIIGPSGSGKSTFIRCINCLEDADGGEIIFEGENIADFSVDINVHRQNMGRAYILTAGVMVWVGAKWGEDYAWRSCFWGASAMGALGIAAAWLFFGNAPEDEGLPPVPVDAKESKVNTSGAQRIALTTPAVWLIAIAGGLFAASRYAIIDWGIFFLQVKKGYSGTDAAMIVTVNSIVGAVSSGLSGIVSDRFFKGSRQELAVSAGLMNVVALVLFMLVPGRHPWLDVTAMVLFGTAVGVLLTFLGGLMAVDRVPKCAAGAALGIAGIGSYLGAGLQSAFSGCLIERGSDGAATLMGYTFAGGYTLDWLAVFWIGVAALSVAFTVAAGRGGKEQAK